MQVILDNDEAWSLMSVITSFLVDHSAVSQDGKHAIRRWRTAHEKGTPAMADLADSMNHALGAYLGEKTNRTIRGKGRYIKRRDRDED
jgi:hypothetical protein